MNESLRERLAALAWRVTPEALEVLSSGIMDLPAWDRDVVVRSTAALPDPQVRSEATALLELARVSDLSPRDLASLLAGAAIAVHAHRDAEHVELVWSGPSQPGSRMRRTSEALLEVAREARKRLTLVTFAAYRVPEVREAIGTALQRGVEVHFVAETEEASQGRLGFDAAKALGAELGHRVHVYEWPHERRPRDARGGTGTLHAKFALADDRVLFVTSANLTEYALESNMELGMLLSGGDIPRLAAKHLARLVDDGLLRRSGR